MKEPNRRIIVGGVDLYDRFGLVLTDDSSYSPPAPKTYTVDIPGGDGSVDVTESLAGDVAYSERTMSLALLYVARGDFEVVKTSVSNFLHGKKFTFQLSFDPEYTYTGRFAIDEYYSKMHYGMIKATVTCDPYKLKESRTLKVYAAGGKTVTLECGRKRQCPTFESESEFVVAWDGGDATVQAGAHKVPALWLTEGDNEVYIDSTPGRGTATIADYAADTVASLADKRLGELFWLDDPISSSSQLVYVTYKIEEL